MEQIATVQKGQWLTLSKLVRIRSVSRGRNQYAFYRSFIHHRSIEITDGGNTDGTGIALSLYNQLSPANRIRIKVHRINTAVPAFPSSLGFAAILRELEAKYLAHEM